MKYIFEVHIEAGHTAVEYAEAWMRASEIIQRARGARGTELHRKIGEPNILVAIANWDSKAGRDAMGNQHDEAVADIIQSVSYCCEIRPIGEFEDPEWVVTGSNL